MDKKMTAVIVAAAVLFILLAVFAGTRSKSRPEQNILQEPEQEFSMQIAEDVKPATQAPETLPVLTTAAEAAGTEKEAAAEQTEKPAATTKKKKNKNKTTTTTVTADDYITATETLAETEPLTIDVTIDRDGVYTTKDDVALYIYTYGELPSNFITKKEAQKLGWEGGSLEPYAPGCCIGGSSFGNYEGKLPEKKGRTYTECDIDTLGKKSRGAKRIVFSNDGLIYYTGDHYETFELLYGEE